jgi:hypothetical protein
MAESHGRMLIGWIQTREGPIQLTATPAARLTSLEMLLSLVREDKSPALAQKILDFHPRGDVPGKWGMRMSQLPQESFDEVFGTDGIIEQVNRFVPSDRGDGEVDEFPPWASGNFASDLLADLTYSLGDFGQAREVFNTLSLQAISDYLRRLGDLRKGPEQREKDGLKDWFWQHATEFTDDFYSE